MFQITLYPSRKVTALDGSKFYSCAIDCKTHVVTNEIFENGSDRPRRLNKKVKGLLLLELNSLYYSLACVNNQC